MKNVVNRAWMQYGEYPNSLVDSIHTANQCPIANLQSSVICIMLCACPSNSTQLNPYPHP